MKKYFLGTAIKITTILDIDTADTATIIVKDSADVAKVTSTTMTKEQNKVYFYILQTANTNAWNAGTFTAEITITYNGYTSYTEKRFEMVDPD